MSKSITELLEEQTRAIERNTEMMRLLLANVTVKTGSTDKKPIIYSQSQVARMFRVSSQTIIRWRQDGRLPSHPGRNGKIVFWEHELREFARTNAITMQS